MIWLYVIAYLIHLGLYATPTKQLGACVLSKMARYWIPHFIIYIC